MKRFSLLILTILFSVFFINLNVFSKAKPVELKIEVFERAIPGYQADNNFWTKWIQQNFGDPNNITVKFVTVVRAQETEKLNMLMAAGDAPDLVFTYDPDVVYNYVTQGGLTDLGDLVKKYGKDLEKYLGPDLMKVGVFDGKQYAIPAKRVLTGCFSTFIRKDWLDILGLPVPTTRDQWYQALKAFKEKDPGKIGSDKVIPLAINIDVNGNITWCIEPLMDSFKDPKITEEQEQCYPRWLKPGTKDGMKFMNKMFNEGLISPEFALDRDAKISDKDTSQGRVGSLISQYDYPYRPTPGLEVELEKNVANGKLIPIDPLLNAAGKKYKRVYPPNGFYIMIPKASKRGVEAMKYLNWMSKPDVLFFLVNGEKGTNYIDEKEGIPVNILVEGEKRISSQDIPIIVNGKEFGSLEKNIIAGSFSAKPEFSLVWRESYKQSITFDKSWFEMYFPLKSNARLKTVLWNKDVEIFTKALTCKPEEFNSVYDKLVDEYMQMGGKEVMDDKIAYYRKNFGSKKK